MTSPAADHALAAQGFLDVARSIEDWSAPTPCSEWNAEALVDHVVGFHDVLVLRPLDVTPDTTRDHPADRWDATAAAVTKVLADPEALEREVDVPGMGRSLLGRVAPILTTDVLIHTWDLACSAGTRVTLEPELCSQAYERAAANAASLSESGMFGSPVEVPEDAPVQDRLLALTGRDPAWTPPG